MIRRPRERTCLRERSKVENENGKQRFTSDNVSTITPTAFFNVDLGLPRANEFGLRFRASYIGYACFVVPAVLLHFPRLNAAVRHGHNRSRAQEVRRIVFSRYIAKTTKVFVVLNGLFISVISLGDCHSN